MASIYDSPEMIGAFLDEVSEQLQLLEEGIMELEEGDNGQALQKVFRVAHTLKGSSSAVGFEEMKRLTHEMENVLEQIRNKKLVISLEVIDILFQATDILNELKKDYSMDRNLIKTDINEIVSIFQTMDSTSIEQGKVKTNPKKSTNDFVNSSKKEKAKEFLTTGNMILINITLFEHTIMKSTRALLMHSYLSENMKVIQTLPDIFSLEEEYEGRNFQFVCALETEEVELEERITKKFIDIEHMNVVKYDPSVAIIEDDCSQDKIPIKSNENKEELEDKNSTKIAKTVRVDVEKLDNIINFMGELVIEQTRISQIGNKLSSQYSMDETVEEFRGVSNHLSRVIGDLQEGVMKTRMLPLRQLYNRLPRMVRDLSLSLNKEIELLLEGGETEMDRTIIEEITDPLIHIIRNCVDHGIETSEVRKSLGKSSVGMVRICAFHQENNIVITVEDDGKGLDVEKIKATAIDRELLSHDELKELSEKEIINLIYRSGFSTSKEISDISGRGVGMEIVRTQIEKLNGIIDIESILGKGTKITIKLPLTLAILTGLLVQSLEEIYAIPMNNIIEIVRKKSDEISNISGKPVALIRNEILPLLRISEYFGKKDMQSSKNIFIVVLGIANKRIGLVVDQLIGNQEIVIKSLGTYIGKVEGLSGATILGDGTIACILDVAAIVNKRNE